MQSTFEDLMRAAEDHYLQTTEIHQFKQQVATLQDRLTAYETLRDQEAVIFQGILDLLEQDNIPNPGTEVRKLLTYWIAILRYASMAMLIEQPETLENQLHWLAPILDRSEFKSLNQKIFEGLRPCLGSALTESQMDQIEPYLQQIPHVLTCSSTQEFAVLS